jgi:hypothetical protein
MLLFIATPFLEELRNGELLEASLFTLVLVMAVFAVGRDRAVLTVAGILAVPAILGKWLDQLQPQRVPPHLILGFELALVVFVVAILLRFILQTAEVDAEVLCAAISVYFLLGVLWSLTYLFVGQSSPASFSFSYGPGSRNSMDAFNAFYLSFGNLTTIGASGITPISKLARTLTVMEAVTGTLYMAVLVARLVALYGRATASKVPDLPN